MSWRHAEPITSPTATTQNVRRRRTKGFTTEDTEDTEFIKDEIEKMLRVLCVLRGKAFCSICNDCYLSRLECFEKSTRLRQIELLVARLDAQEKSIAARQREARDVEDRVIRLRQSVERQHAEHSRERGAENRAFEGHRYERRPAIERSGADVDRVGRRRDP